MNYDMFRFRRIKTGLSKQIQSPSNRQVSITFERMSEFSENNVKHDPKEKLFFIDLPSGKKAFLQYEPTEEKVDLWHTEVPPECRGQGVAGILA